MTKPPPSGVDGRTSWKHSGEHGDMCFSCRATSRLLGFGANLKPMQGSYIRSEAYLDVCPLLELQFAVGSKETNKLLVGLLLAEAHFGSRRVYEFCPPQHWEALTCKPPKTAPNAGAGGLMAQQMGTLLKEITRHRHPAFGGQRSSDMAPACLLVPWKPFPR